MERKIKVAHVTTVDLSLRSLLLNQMCSLREAGYEVSGISLPGPEVRPIEEAGIRHFPVSMTRNFTPLADLRALWQLYRVMRREKFTIVHTHTPKAGLLGQLAARLAGVPIVINTLHGFYFHDHMPKASRRFYIAMEKIAARCSDRILSQNKEDIQTAIRERICLPEKIGHLGNGIDLEEFDPERVSARQEAEARARLGIDPDSPVVGFVGRLAGRRKGFLDFLAAAGNLSVEVPGIRFLIVGEPDRGKPDAVEPAVAEEYGVARQCCFAGNVPNRDLPPLYRLMDLLVLPSLFEGVPRVVMEAAAMGVPAVVSDVKGNREAVVPGKTGMLVPFGDWPALAAAILRILREPGIAREMGREARCLALDCFNERIVFEKVKAEYLRLLKAKLPSLLS